MATLSPLHYAQMGIAGLVQGALVGAVALPQYAHYLMVGCVILVAVLSPLGLASPAMLTAAPGLLPALVLEAPAAPGLLPALVPEAPAVAK